MSGIQFDNKISLGHIISIGLIIFGGITAYLRQAKRHWQHRVGREMSRARGLASNITALDALACDVIALGRMTELGAV